MLRYCLAIWTSIWQPGISATTSRAALRSRSALVGQLGGVEIAEEDLDFDLGDAAFDRVGVQKAVAAVGRFGREARLWAGGRGRRRRRGGR